MLITSLLNLSASAQQINRLYILWQLDFNGSISTKIQNKNTLRKSDVSNCDSHGLAVSMWAHMWDSLVSVFYDTHLFTGSISSVPTSPPPWTRTNELFEHPDCRQGCDGPQQQAYWELFGNGNGMRPQDLPHQVKMIMRKVADEPKTTWWSEGSWTTVLSQ